MRTPLAVSMTVLALTLACRQAAEPGVPGLDLQDTEVPLGLLFSAALGGDSLVFIVAHNTTAAPDTLNHGVCAFAARIWNGPNFSHMAWQSVPTGNYLCALALIGVLIPANDSARMIAARLAPAPPDIGPPPAYGDVRAYVKVNGQVLELEAGLRNQATLRGVGAARRAA